jgi:hypothetical protein
MFTHQLKIEVRTKGQSLSLLSTFKKKVLQFFRVSFSSEGVGGNHRRRRGGGGLGPPAKLDILDKDIQQEKKLGETCCMHNFLFYEPKLATKSHVWNPQYLSHSSKTAPLP